MADGLDITLPAAEKVSIDGDTTAQTNTDGSLDIDVRSATSAFAGVDINAEIDDGASSAYALKVTLDDDAIATALTGYAIHASIDSHTARQNSGTVYALYAESDANSTTETVVGAYIDGTNMDYSLRSNGTADMVGFPRVVSNKTAEYTPTNDESGTTFTNNGAAGNVIFNLDSITKVGWWATFLAIDGAQDKEIQLCPSATQIILLGTNAAEDRYTTITLGSSVTLQLLSATEIGIIAEKGTWADAN
jgi:hypothetical protein